MDQMTKMLEEQLKRTKAVHEAEQKKRDVEYDITRYCVEKELFDFFKLDLPKLRRAHGLPPNVRDFN